MSTIKTWVAAARLRTLPLAFSAIGMGGALAYMYDAFDPAIFLLCVFTTLGLQVLSNFANDYGDFVNGVDHAARKGPVRMVQSGAISAGAMKRAVYVSGMVALGSGIALLITAFKVLNANFMLFLLLGVSSIGAAIKYTVGKTPYGYAGFGDFFVFVFFGLVGVLGTCFLQTGWFKWTLLCPAVTMGFFSVGVLNINNIRDIESDMQAGKKSLPVRMGTIPAKVYHTLLIVGAFVFAILFVYKEVERMPGYLFLGSSPFFAYNIYQTWQRKGKELDGLLRQLALSILLFVFLFALGISLV